MIRQVTKRGRTFSVEDLPISEGWDFWATYERGWESDTHDILEQNLTVDTVLLDIGAWVGPFTLFSSPLCKSIIALEPDPVAVDMLEKNIQHNNVQNATVLKRALWDGSPVTLGVKERGDMGDSMTSVVYSSCERTITVPSSTLEGLADEFSLDPQNIFIKMDIEGAESEVILMNWDFISTYLPPIWLSVHSALVPDPSDYLTKVKKVFDLYEIKDPVPTTFESVLLKSHC